MRLILIEEPLSIFHNELSRQRVSKRVDWEYCRDWAMANRHLFTEMALGYFLVIYCVNPAAQQGAALSALRPLLMDVRRYGRYNVKLVGLCLLYMFVYPWVGRALTRRQQTSALYRVMGVLRRQPSAKSAQLEHA